ncbi:unnamed protein product, partial [Iphiclides podalirius]
MAGQGQTGRRGMGGEGRYVSAVAADGDAWNADDLQMPSAPPPTPAASCVLAYRRSSLPLLFDISPPLLTLACYDDNERNFEECRL